MTKTARVLRKLQASFPEAARAAADAALDLYLERASEPDSERVLLAILKLSEGDEAKLLAAVEAALADPRDVLAWAEYPDQMKLGPHEDSSTARVRDREQYLRWLGEDGS